MKRFFITFSLLTISLFIVVSGVDATLDHLLHSPVQSSFTVYNERGTVLMAYDGDLSVCKAFKPERVVAPGFLHRS